MTSESPLTPPSFSTPHPTCGQARWLCLQLTSLVPHTLQGLRDRPRSCGTYRTTQCRLRPPLPALPGTPARRLLAAALASSSLCSDAPSPQACSPQWPPGRELGARWERALAVGEERIAEGSQYCWQVAAPLVGRGQGATHATGKEDGKPASSQTPRLPHLECSECLHPLSPPALLVLQGCGPSLPQPGDEVTLAGWIKLK